MISIEYLKNCDDELEKRIDTEFSKFAIKNKVICNYSPFNLVAKENENLVGILTGHTSYKEVHISELIVFEQYRGKNIGSKLIEAAESYYKNKDFKYITLSTYNFQAPEFYIKHGFQIEFIRKDKINAKLTKYFFIKYL